MDSPFRFMDLPAEVRCLIYEVAARKEEGVGVEDFECYIKHVFTSKLPPILDTCHAIRMEALQTFVQGNIILMYDFERREISPRTARAGSALFCAKDIQEYIDTNCLEFNFLANIRGARLHIDRRDMTTRFIGLKMLRDCTNVQNLVLDLATTAKLFFPQGQWLVDKTIPSVLLQDSISEIQVNAVRDRDLPSIVSEAGHRFDHEWAQLLCAKLIKSRGVGVVRVLTIWDSKRKYQDVSWRAT